MNAFYDRGFEYFQIFRIFCHTLGSHISIILMSVYATVKGCHLFSIDQTMWQAFLFITNLQTNFFLHINNKFRNLKFVKCIYILCVIFLTDLTNTSDFVWPWWSHKVTHQNIFMNVPVLLNVLFFFITYTWETFAIYKTRFTRLLYANESRLGVSVY